MYELHVGDSTGLCGHNHTPLTTHQTIYRLLVRRFLVRFLDPLRDPLRLLDPLRLFPVLSKLTHPNDPFLVPYPALTSRFSLDAVPCFFLETRRPHLFIINWGFINRPEVCLAVPCHTSARVPIFLTNDII